MDQDKLQKGEYTGDDRCEDRKREGLTVSDRPDTLSPKAAALLEALRQALSSAKSDGERDEIRKNYLSQISAREIVARRLFAGRDTEGSSLVTLSDPDGKPRLRLQVDKTGQASIAFLDPLGRTIRTIKP